MRVRVANLILCLAASTLPACSFDPVPDFAQAMQMGSELHLASLHNGTDCPVRVWVSAGVVDDAGAGSAAVLDGPWLLPAQSSISIAPMAYPTFATAVEQAEREIGRHWFDEITWIVDPSIEAGPAGKNAWLYRTRVPLLLGANDSLETPAPFFTNCIQLTSGVGPSGIMGGPIVFMARLDESPISAASLPNTPAVVSRTYSEADTSVLAWVAIEQYSERR